MQESRTHAIRRSDALSKSRIVDAAIEILDTDASRDGSGLTLRVLMEQLSTGSGAIYHHVSTMNELRELAADEVLRSALENAVDGEPDELLLAAALTIFDSIQAHPWIGAQLTRNAVQPAVVRMWTIIGVQLNRLGLHGAAGAAAGSTLTSFILGSVAHSASDASRRASAEQRTAQLQKIATEWAGSTTDPLTTDALTQDIATQIREHDDRQQFQDGIRIILRGIAASAP